MNNYNQRMKQIDEFLKSFQYKLQWISERCNQMNSYDADKFVFDQIHIQNDFYDELVQFNISNNDRKENLQLSKHTSKIIRREYENFPRIKPGSYYSSYYFYTPYKLESYFKTDDFDLNFSNPNSNLGAKGDEIKENYAIKLCIPIKSEYLQSSARKILDFLTDRNIEYSSSLTKYHRFDSMIINLYNPKDADILADFIANEKYIQDGMGASNPFAFQHNGIAYTVENLISYNMVISTIIEDYFMNKVKDGKIADIGIQEFYNYAVNLYKKWLSASTDDIRDMVFDGSSPIIFPIHRIDRYLQIFELFLRTFDPKFTYEDYIEFYERVSGNKFNKTTQQDKGEISQQTPKYTDAIVNIDSLTYILVTMTKKLGVENIDTVFLSLESYLQTGNSVYLINYNNLRNAIDQSNFRDSMNNILNNNMSLSDYLNQLGITEEYIKSKCGSITETKKSKK